MLHLCQKSSPENVQHYSAPTGQDPFPVGMHVWLWGDEEFGTKSEAKYWSEAPGLRFCLNKTFVLQRGRKSLLALGIFWKDTSRAGNFPSSPSGVLSARCEGINVFSFSPPFWRVAFKCFPIPHPGSSWGSEGQLKDGTLGNKLQNFLCPRVGICFSLVFQFAFPFDSFPLKGIKGFQAGEVTFWGWRCHSLAQTLSSLFPKLVPPLTALSCICTSPKERGKELFQNIQRCSSSRARESVFIEDFGNQNFFLCFGS